MAPHASSDGDAAAWTRRAGLGAPACHRPEQSSETRQRNRQTRRLGSLRLGVRPLDFVRIPDYARPADQSERDLAGAAVRRCEDSLHSYWLELARRRHRDWWTNVVPEATRTAVLRRRRSAATNPERAVRRMQLRDFAALFNATFPAEFSSLFEAVEANMRMDVLVNARDAAAHPGRPYLASEAPDAVAIAWELALLIPGEFRNPPDLVPWLAAQSIVDSESWEAEPYDVTIDCPLTPEFLGRTPQGGRRLPSVKPRWGSRLRYGG